MVDSWIAEGCVGKVVRMRVPTRQACPGHDILYLPPESLLHQLLNCCIKAPTLAENE